MFFSTCLMMIKEAALAQCYAREMKGHKYKHKYNTNKHKTETR